MRDYVRVGLALRFCAIESGGAIEKGGKHYRVAGAHAPIEQTILPGAMASSGIAAAPDIMLSPFLAYIFTNINQCNLYISNDLLGGRSESLIILRPSGLSRTAACDQAMQERNEDNASDSGNTTR